MRLTLSLPIGCAVHHTADGLDIELPDAALPTLSAQIGAGRRLSIDEVCARYTVSRPTLAKWERAGLTPIIIGRTKFYTEEELRRFEAAQTTTATSGRRATNLQP
jgi:hypothetical protein